MATSHDYDGTIRRVAPTGGATAGNIVNDTTDFVCALALTTATSGNSYTAKVEGLVKSVAKVSGAAWTAGQALAYSSGSSAFTHVITGAHVVAHAAAAAASADTTGDVILCLPMGLG